CLAERARREADDRADARQQAEAPGAHRRRSSGVLPPAIGEPTMDLGLKGKVALVTAASKGMGRACAMQFAAEGARVAICARNEGDIKVTADEIKTKTGAEVMAMKADVTKAADVKALVARTIETFGGVDVLVANC